MSGGAEFPAKGPWAVRLTAEDSRSLGAIRLLAGISVCEVGNDLWIRGDSCDDALDIALRKLPGVRFAIVENSKLLAQGKRIPQGNVPGGNWVSLNQWMIPQIQTGALAGGPVEKVAMSFERCSDAMEAKIIVATAPAWRHWASSASMVRLRKLRFAISEEQRVAIWGEPLPPIAGQRFVEQDGIAWPSGLSPQPRIDPAILASILRLNQGDLALFDESGAYHWIDASQFVGATRSAVRTSVPVSGVV